MGQLLNITDKIINTDVIDSRDVAIMMNKSHADLMKDIQGSGKNLGIIPVLTKGNFPVVDYFIESSYKDKKGESRKCFLVTKMGCEMLANKLKGEKGILFTAAYVKRFNMMQTSISNQLIANTKVIVVIPSKNFSRNNTKNTFSSLPAQSIPEVYPEFIKYVKSLETNEQKAGRLLSAYKGICIATRNAINSEEISRIKEDLLSLNNSFNRKVIQEKNETIKRMDPPIEDYNVINVHPFTCNCVINYKSSTNKDSIAYKNWKNKFPRDEVIVDKSIDFTKEVNLWLKFDHKKEFDVTNFSKTIIDMLVSVYHFNDNLIQLKCCVTNKIVDDYKDGKIYYIFSQK